MVEELKVYLDHHISRDDFLYKHSHEKMPRDVAQYSSMLRLKDLYGDKSMNEVLCKPDFQRVTWAWTPRECVSLLDSIVNEQIIPSIIMWLSPEGRWYVLDGGHRISAVLAWLEDDWGDYYAKKCIEDEESTRKIQDAANEVRFLMKGIKIGSFNDYIESYKKIESLPKELREYEEEINSDDAKRATFYRGVISGLIGFPLQWVKGDFDKAETSFLKINSSGSRLTPWEIKLVENRTSSFARVVMSLSNISKVEQYWPTKAPRGEDESQIRPKIGKILENVMELHKVLFEPTHDAFFTRVQQPILAEPNIEPHKKPAYLAELFTIIKGNKGQAAQMERLIREDKSSTSSAIVDKGLQLVQESLDTFSHLIGSDPHSLALVPALYFYSENGKYVRGMLYGLIYWLFVNNDENTLMRKKLYFSAYREAFEEVLMAKKKEVFNAFGRTIGSGSEITGQVAKYYGDLLSLLEDHRGNIKSEVFVKDYNDKFKQMSLAGTKNASQLPYTNLPRCTICRGLIDPSMQTNREDLAYTHHFCRGNTNAIEGVLRGEKVIGANRLPEQRPQQLSFLDFE